MVLTSHRWDLSEVEDFYSDNRAASIEQGKIFFRRQEAVRKCVERLFGVLYRRYKSFFVASEKMSATKVRHIAITAAIMHNMTVEIRKSSYTSDGGGGVSRLYDEATETVGKVVESVDASNVGGTLNRAYVADTIKLPGYHPQLKDALINHIWATLGGVVSAQWNKF